MFNCEIPKAFQAVLLTRSNSNAMTIEFSEDLAPTLDREGADLQIQRTLVPEQTILDRYLSRGYGNSYNFDQESRLESF
jgi:hypothetical protein